MIMKTKKGGGFTAKILKKTEELKRTLTIICCITIQKSVRIYQITLI